MLKRLLLLHGLAIVGVVCSHASEWVYISMFWWTDRYMAVSVPNYDQLGSLSYYSIVVFQKIGVFAVPAFLFTSGFFVAYAGRGKSAFTWKMVGVRLKGLLIPYFIWSVVILLGDWLQGTAYAPAEYLRRLLLGDAVPAYYYVILLCQFFLLSPLLVPIAKTKGRQLLVGSAAILLGVLCFYYLELYGALAQVEMPFVTRVMELLRTRIFVRFLFFFVFGLVSGFHLRSLREWLARYKWILLIVAVTSAPLAILETELIFRLTGLDWRGGIFTITGSLYAVSFILAFLAFDKARVPFSGLIYDLGRASFGIYLLHSTALEFFARSIQRYAPKLMVYQVLFLWVLVILAVGVPFLFMKAVAKSPLRKYHRLLFG